MKREYKAPVEVGAPQVNYRETILKEADFDYLHKKQTGGAGQFAHVVGRVRPLIEENKDREDQNSKY
jgi:elongation factor G